MIRRGIGLRVLVPLALIGAVTLIVTTALTAFATGRMIDDARRLDAQRAMERIQSIELATGQALRAVADDYAHWNDMVAFVAAPSDAFRENNFAVETLDSLDADGLLVLDARGTLLVSGMTDSGIARWSPDHARVLAFDGASRLWAMPEDLVALIRDSAPARLAAREESRLLAWVPSQRHWLQVGVAAIGPYNDTSDERRDGLVAFIRVLDEERMADRRKRAQADYALQPLGHRVPAEADLIQAVLADPEHGPQAMAVGRHRFVLAPTLENFRWFATAQQAAFLIVALLAIAVVVERRVVRRVDALRVGVEGLRSGRRHALALPGPDDELSVLGDEFSRLYASLERTRNAWRGAALTDALSGLPNRSALIRDLGDHGRADDPAAMLFFIDLDGFKQVNDQFGHAVGDECLREVAMAMARQGGEHVRLYRLGGDEFAALGHGDAHGIGERLVAAVGSIAATDPVRFGRIGASIGWVALRGGVEVSDALAAADIAMYEAKREGGACVIAFTDEMGERRRERLSLEDRLRHAIAEQRIRAVFQPIVDAGTDRLYAVEALARWRDEERGDVPPARFIELAEAAGLVARIDLAVLAQGLACLRVLADLAPDCRLQVNLSPRSLDSPGIVDAILDACRQAHVAPARLTIEVTESAFASEAVTPHLVLASLRSHGFGIALDDFGVGHSSLARLARFAPDTLKIDGQFVRDHEGAGGMIVETVIALARHFRIRTTAEFVETDAQRLFLVAKGCDALQGYGIGVPMRTEALVEWVRARL